MPKVKSGFFFLKAMARAIIKVKAKKDRHTCGLKKLVNMGQDFSG
jgi:hypothetical protein